MEPRMEEVELVELTAGAIAAVEVLAVEQRCPIFFEAPVDELVVTGNGKRTRQILLNLLSNALKYGQGSPVHVRLAREPHGTVIEVTDHGPGISEADLSRIFDDFVRLGDPVEAGTGLGLPIARRLAQLLGGSLDVSSIVGQGSTFRLTLPSTP